jgi:hypothetical protein
MKGVSTLALEPVDSGEKVTVNGVEGQVVRSVAIRGGVEYAVRVADPDAPANETLKIPPAVDPIAHQVLNPEEYERREDADREQREALENSLNDERQAYTEREQKLAGEAEDNASDDEDPSVNSHAVSAEATRQVQQEKSKSAKDGGKLEQQKTPTTPVATSQTTNAKAAEERKSSK